VVQEALSACTAEHVTQVQHAMDVIYQQHSQGFQHHYEAGFQLLDVDMSGMPCGPKAAFATKGYEASQYHRRGRQVGRVLATLYEEVVARRLFAGNVQLLRALQPLVEAAEAPLELDETKRARTIIRVDAGSGTLDDLNWLLARGNACCAWPRRSPRGSRTRTGPSARLAGSANPLPALFAWCGALPCAVADKTGPSPMAC